MLRGRVVGAAQTVPVAGDVAQNIEEHIRLLKVAARLATRLLVFPELSLTGYEMSLAAELAFTQNDARLEPLVKASRLHGMTLVVGAPLRVADRLHIAAFIIGGGEAVQVYTKQHLGAFPPSASVDGTIPPGEATVFSAGASDPQVLFDGHQGAVAICADANRVTHALKAAQRGAKTYLVSAFAIPSEFDEAAANLQAHATRHGMAVVFANYGASSGGMASAGQSGIWSQNGELLGRLDRQGSGVIVALEANGCWEIATRTSR